MSMFKSFSRAVQASFNTIAEGAEATELLAKSGKAAATGLYNETLLESQISLNEIKDKAKTDNKLTDEQVSNIKFLTVEQPSS